MCVSCPFTEVDKTLYHAYQESNVQFRTLKFPMELLLYVDFNNSAFNKLVLYLVILPLMQGCM